jgi:thaumarchaeosortase
MKHLKLPRFPSAAEIRQNLPGILFPQNLILPVLLVPIVLLMAGDPRSFQFVWSGAGQIGRGSFIFLGFIVLWEWFDSKGRLNRNLTKRRLFLTLGILAAALAFYAARVWLPVLSIALNDWGLSHGVSKDSVDPQCSCSLSWLLTVDYVAYAVFAFFETIILLGPKGFKDITTPVVYSIGTASLVVLDAFYPYDSLAFMQNWVGVIWRAVLVILFLIGVHVPSSTLNFWNPPTVYWAGGNRLLTYGYHGFMEIVIFWPSSGVVSMVIFSLIIVVLVIKLDAPAKRKIIYAAVGALGTFFVNVVRVSMIVSYVLFISLDVELFHEVIGEILFFIWIIVFLSLVLRHENKLIARKLNLRVGPASQLPS